jgi:hypothetical protein
MAKMFYTMEETKNALVKNEEEIRQYAREGRLREFRDGPRLMFKADQVEQLKAELSGSGDALSLAPSDSGAPISLADSKSGTATPKDSHFSDVGSGLAGVPSPGKIAPTTPGSGSGLANLPGTGLTQSGSGLSGSGLSGGGPRGGGITIFDVDDSQKADPSAQTAINPSIQDQINLESVGSGSGLLELTRESDDTSLGAVFDELTPGGARPKGGLSSSGVVVEETEGDVGLERSTGSALSAPVYVEPTDSVGAGIGAAGLVAAAVVCFGGFILAATLAGYRPDILNDLQWEKNLKMYLAMAFGASMLVGVIGFFISRATSK